jgi:hypothetical protein
LQADLNLMVKIFLKLRRSEMPSSDLKLQLSRKVEDLKAVRIPGLDRPLESLTLGELIEMRPGGGGDEVADSYSVNAFTDNVSVSTSSLVEQIGQIAKERSMRGELDDVRLTELRERIDKVGRVVRLPER